ncbi:sugar ABC transporter permease [Luteimicrobium xylanilyticum]|uniref:Trehalose transport system permease protein SugA n=1 Tax=Luteimicrobium xylanilyticum TaxID=1133546 RepID=A0A5P9QCJ2_9MICO|nr:sugar ABC transporter permease [Luteimicrobium xylanilyticum]QFU98822.1 Trehalose transport system permease protein SugA [Luteimicrobium xylanilyticum]
MAVTTVDPPVFPAPARLTFRDKWLAKDGWARRGPLLPALVFVIVLTQLPFVATLVISLMRWNSNYPDDIGFTGLSNFTTVFTDADLRSAVFVTIEMTVVVVLVSLVLGLGVALLLNRQFFGRGIVRTLMIAPFLIVPVAAALFWKHGIYNPVYGLLNGLLTLVHGPQVDWITQYPRLAVDVQLIWQWTPFMMLILLAGLQSRPAEVLEAAAVDGASPWKVFRFITLPHMRRYLELGALLGSIYIVQNFDSVYTLTAGALGTANLPYQVYETLYSANDYGLASAQGVIVVVGSIVIATFALRTVSTLFSEEVSR